MTTESEANTAVAGPSEALAGAVGESWRSFLQSCEALRPELYRYCRYLTRSPWDADDLVQDTLARAFVTLGCLHQNLENPRAWLFRVASNVWLNRVRAQRELPHPAPLGDAARHRGSLPEKRSPVLERALTQLQEYFAGQRRDFDLPLDPRGTEFQLRVWQRLLKIPYGETTTYGALASELGDARASRAVGLANGSNPIPIVIPCHRVIGADGSLTGFGGGLAIKQQLLELERTDRQPRLF